MYCVWRADAASQTAHIEPNRQRCLVHGSIRSPFIAESSPRSTEDFPRWPQESLKFAESKHFPGSTSLLQNHWALEFRCSTVHTTSCICRVQLLVGVRAALHFRTTWITQLRSPRKNKLDIRNTPASSGSIAVTLRKLANVKSSFGSAHGSHQNPSQMNLLYESFSARASGLRPVSLGVFRLASGSTSDASLPV